MTSLTAGTSLGPYAIRAQLGRGLVVTAHVALASAQSRSAAGDLGGLLVNTTVWRQYHRAEVLVQGGKFFPERTRLSERVDLRRQLFEDGLGRPWPAPGVPRRGPVDHHVTRACDRGRGVPDRATVLAESRHDARMLSRSCPAASTSTAPAARCLR